MAITASIENAILNNIVLYSGQVNETCDINAKISRHSEFKVTVNDFIHSTIEQGSCFAIS
jgi:hypothetical protein